MKDVMFWLLAFLGSVAVALIVALPLRGQLAQSARWLCSAIDGLGPFRKLAVLAVVVHLTIFAGGKHGGTNEVEQTGGTNGVEIVEGDGTNAPPMMLMMSMPLSGDQPPTVSPEDIARGWQLVEVRTNHNASYAMPEDATLATNWWVRGAFEDVKEIGLGSFGGLEGWRFPFGSNEYDSAWAFTWGKLRFALSDAETEIAAVGSPMSAVPYCSRLWTAADTNGARLVTWENFALGRVPSTSHQPPTTNHQYVSAQIELRKTGDFVTRSNEVETICRRVDPDDYDGDGWRNDDDPNPYNWDEFGDYFYQELPAGANEDAYCWVDVRPRWNSDICFYGDAPSDLEDPYIWAKAGETYRVHLLIGKTYTVVSPYPVDVLGSSDPSIEVDGDGTCELEIVWPVSFSAMEGNGANFMMRVVPSGLGGTFEWTQHCCAITGYGNQFWWAHDRYCYCSGCYAYGWYSYEGYALWCEGGHCCCPHENDDDDPYEPQEDDGPYAASASVEFSAPVVIFEDAYTNMPGEVVARRSTQTTLTCTAHGGETGGTATFSIVNGDKLVSCSGGALPVTRFVPPQQKVEFEIVYEGKLPSGGERDVVAKADFTERGTGTRHSTVEEELTSVKVELCTDKTAPANPDNHRHVYGIAEDIHYRSYPDDAAVQWSFPSVFIDRGPGMFMCPWSIQGMNGSISVTAYSASFTFVCSVVEPIIEVRNPRVNAESGEVNPVIGESGHLLLYLDLYAAPAYVSFQGVQMQEVPDESQSCPHQGYYDDRTKGGNWSHTANDGAGRWHTVLSSGYVMTDRAGRRTSYDSPWSAGWKEWVVPMEWGEGGVVSVPFSPNPTTQRFELQSDGHFTIRKHGHYAERNVLGLKWCDGGLVW